MAASTDSVQRKEGDEVSDSVPVPIWSLSAGELVAAYRSGETDPERALQATLTRIDDVNGSVNAVVTLDLDGAWSAAAAATERYRRGAEKSPLDGVPVTVKDNLFVGGMRATWGSRLFADFTAPQDDLPVAALRAAGVVIIGKTNTPELALLGCTTNRLFGSTANPWALDRSPGGSSGGAVAAVAAGFGPLALGTDSGGSIRRPAAQTGVAGLKPGLGRVPRRYGFPPLLGDIQVIGPVARTVSDLRSIFQLIAAPDPVEYKSKAKLRIAVMGSVGDFPVEREIAIAFQETCDFLRSLSHDVVEIEDLWDVSEAGTLFRSLSAVGVAKAVSGFDGWEDLVTPVIRDLALGGIDRRAVDYLSDLDRLMKFRTSLREAMKPFDVVATPASPTLAWPDIASGPRAIAGRSIGVDDAGSLSVAINLAGLPALVIPIPVAGLPVGLQLIGSMMSEELLLDLAAEIEARRPWRRLAPI